MKQPPKDKSIFNKEFKKEDNRPTTQYLKSLDVGGDGNTSISDVGIEAGISLIGGKLAGKALAKIGGRNIKSIGSKVSKFFNNYINPSSGKDIAKQAKTLINKRNTTLAKGNVIPKGELGYKTAQSMSNARKQAQNKIDFNNPIDEVNLKTNAIKEPKLTLDSVFEAPFSKNPTISTRTGPGVVENVKLTKGNARKQLNEQLKNQSKKKTVNDPDPRKHFGSIENPSNPNSSTIKSITDITRSRGKIIDGEDLSKATYTPFSTNTERMGITVKFKKSGVKQNYYKSSSLGGKRFTQGRLEGKDTFDKWIAFEGKGDYGNPKNKNYIKDWYVKDQGFETGYGSKTNDYMLDNLDKHIDPDIAKSATESVRAFRDKYMKFKK